MSCSFVVGQRPKKNWVLLQERARDDFVYSDAYSAAPCRGNLQHGLTVRYL